MSESKKHHSFWNGGSKSQRDRISETLLGVEQVSDHDPIIKDSSSWKEFRITCH